MEQSGGGISHRCRSNPSAPAQPGGPDASLQQREREPANVKVFPGPCSGSPQVFLQHGGQPHGKANADLVQCPPLLRRHLAPQHNRPLPLLGAVTLPRFALQPRAWRGPPDPHESFIQGRWEAGEGAGACSASGLSGAVGAAVPPS